MGSLATIPLYLVLRRLSLSWYLAFIVVLAFLGAGASTRAEALWGKDPARVVIDEVAGMLIALIGRPRGVKEILAAFILFRVFDILKPAPVKNLEALPAGLGIMADDVAAGLLSALVLAGIRVFARIRA